MSPVDFNTEAQMRTADMQEIAKLVGGTVVQAATTAALFYGIDQVRILTGIPATRCHYIATHTHPTATVTGL